MKKVIAGIKKIYRWSKKNKIYAGLIIIVLVGAGYFSYQKLFVKPETVKYLTGKVEKGSLVSSISGTGQISVSNQVNINSKASGDVVGVYVKVGQEVKAGTLLASLDAREALKTARDAEDSLETARLSLEKLKQPADQLSLLQSENSLAAAKESRQQSEDNLQKSYEDGYNTVSNAFMELPVIMAGLKDLLYGNGFADNYSNIDWYFNQGIALNYNNTEIYEKVLRYRDDVNVSYAKARGQYDNNFDFYKNVSRNSSTSTIENLILETYETTKLIADAVKNANNFLDLVQDLMQNYSVKMTIPALMTTHQSALDTYTSKTNSQLTGLLSIKNTIANSRNSLVISDRSIAEKTISLANLKAGADALELRSSQLSVRQKEDSLSDAKEKLADYSLRASFDGVIATVNIKKGETASSGATAFVLITKQKIATIALNEVDIAKIKVGQKVILTFDAVADLNITGEVAEIDTLGTTSQGVVSYNVKIVFDVQDDRVKSGMSISAGIIVNKKDDVLMVSNSAIKTQNGTSYVENLVKGVPQKINVIVGDRNDLMAEISSGLTEGEEIITQTIKIGATAAASTGNSANRSFGGGGGMIFGGAGR